MGNKNRPWKEERKVSPQKKKEQKLKETQKALSKLKWEAKVKGNKGRSDMFDE